MAKHTTHYAAQGIAPATVLNETMKRKVGIGSGDPVDVDKVTKYKWGLVDEPGVFLMIPKAQLKVDATYQRDYNEKRAQRMASNWSWVLCSTLTVADRDGEFFVVTGQHRLGAANKRSDIKELPCMVFSSKGVGQEAKAFTDEASHRKSIDWVDRIRAYVAAGDPIAEAVTQALADAGRVPTRRQSASGFGCVGALYVAWSDNADVAARTLRAAAEICRGMPIDHRLFSALLYIDKRTSTTFLADARVVERLSEIGAVALVEEIHRAAAIYARGGPRVYATAVLQRFNKGLRHKVEMPDYE